MGLGSAYQAGLRVPTPFEEQVSSLRGGGGAYPQNKYRSGGGGGDGGAALAFEKEKYDDMRSDKRSRDNQYSGTHAGNLPPTAEEFKGIESQKKRDFDATQAGLNRGQKDKDREQREKESARSAGLDSRKVAIDEAEGGRKAGDYKWKQGQLKRIQSYKDAVKALARGDLPAVKQFWAKDWMDQQGISKEDFKDPARQWDYVSQLQKAIPDIQRLPDGNIEVTYPDGRKGTYTNDTFMGEVLGRFNPANEHSAKQQADLEKTRAETRKIDRSGGITQKEIYEAAAEYADTGDGAIDADKYRQFVENGGPPPGENKPGLRKPGYTGSLSDGAPAAPNYTVKQNPETGQRVKIFEDGRVEDLGIVGTPKPKPKPPEPKRGNAAGLKPQDKPATTPKPSKAGITSQKKPKGGEKIITNAMIKKEIGSAVAGVLDRLHKSGKTGVDGEGQKIPTVAEVTEKSKPKASGVSGKKDKEGDDEKNKNKNEKKKKKKGKKA